MSISFDLSEFTVSLRDSAGLIEIYSDTWVLHLFMKEGHRLWGRSEDPYIGGNYFGLGPLALFIDCF